MYPDSHSYFMSIDKPTVVLKRFFGNSLGELFKTFEIFCGCLSKFRILRSPKHHLLRLYRVSPLWRQGLNRDKQMYISSQVKSLLRKLWDREKAKIMTVIYSCQMYLSCTILCCTFS